MKGKAAIPWMLAILLVMLTGCALFVPKPEKPVDPALASIEQRIRQEVELWKGIPYQWGGTAKTGVDCSGLVMVLYQDLFGILLPRTAEHQIRHGTRMHRHQLRAGDLIFFSQPEGKLHIGIYLSEGQFAHASVSRGVMISNIEEPYWQNSFKIARRVIPI